MRHYIILPVAFSFIALSAAAQSRLRVSLTDNSRITVEVDYKHFPTIGTSITVGDLPPGRHQIRIFSERENRFGRQIQDRIYEGRAKTSEGNITLFELDPESGSINVYEENIDSFAVNPMIHHEVGAGDANMQPAAQHLAPKPSGTFTDAKLAALKAKADDINTDTRKMSTIKEALVGEKITTDQVGKIMDMLGFESSREEFAEWAYNIVVDKENYNTLFDKFSYKENQDALDNFLKKQ